MRLPWLLFLTLGALSTAWAQEPIELQQGIFHGKAVTYELVNGRGRLGDVDLGPADQLKPESLSPASGQLLWPGGTIPYIVDSTIPNQQRVLDAIAMWNAQTPLKLTTRKNEPNYVAFTRTFLNNQICTSAVGMVGGMQTLGVDDLCTTLNLAHSIGHAVGLYAEQTRPDRDFYVVPNPANIDKRYLTDFALQVPGAAEIGPYDYASLMHYSRYGRAVDRNLVSLETNPPGIPLDGTLSTGISLSDVDAVLRLYGTPPSAITITSNPPGLEVLVDNALITTPQTFNWSAGSTHTLDVPAVQGDGSSTRYIFARWSDNGTKAHALTASADATVYTVNFVRQFLFVSSASPNTGGTVKVTPPTPDGYYTEGTTLSLTAAPATGFQFSTWNNPLGSILTTAHGISAPSISFVLAQAGLNYIGTFVGSAVDMLVVTTDPPGLPVSVGGTVLPSPRNIQGNPGSTLTVSATATISFGVGANRYVFLGWTDTGAATHTVNVPKTSPYGSVTARYQTQHLVTTSFLGPGTITVLPPSADGYYADGTLIRITATPSPGAALTRWDGDATGTGLVQILTVNKQISMQATFQQPFTLAATNILNAASFLYTPVSPGEIVTLFGLNIGPPGLVGLALDPNGKVVTSLASCSVLFDGIAAPLVYASLNQIAAVVPYEVAGHPSTNVQISLGGGLSNAVVLPVGTTSPALFSSNSSGRGGAAIAHLDGTINSPLNPAAKGSIVLLFGTGEGQTTPAGLDGSVANNLPLPAPSGVVTVLIGGPPGVGVPAQVLYAGAAPGDVAGVLQLDIVIPQNVPSGVVPISISVGGSPSYDMTTIAIR